MANEKNLIPLNERTKEEQRKIASRGGKASGKKRRENKTVRTILTELLESQIQDNEQFSKIASKLGVDSKKSVKDIFTMICLLNSVKFGNLGDLEKLVKLIGEDGAEDTNNGILDELVQYMKCGGKDK